MNRLRAIALLAGALWLTGAHVVLASCLAVQTKVEPAPEMDPLTRYEITFEGESYSVVPPVGWRAETDASSGILRFSDRQGTARVAMTFSSSNSTAILATPETLRAYAVPDLSQAEVLGAFSVPVGGASGKAVDLGWMFYGTARRCRAAVVPLRKGNVSFVLTCESSGFKNAEQVVNGLMTSFQPSPSAGRSSKP